MAFPPLITSEKLSRVKEVRFGLSTRNGGVSPEPYGMNTSLRVGDEAENVRANRRRILGFLGIDGAQLAAPLQCHSNVVRAVAQPGEYPACDGLTTDRISLALVISVADCLPIVLYDARHRAVSLVHAGWRGTSGQIVQSAVRVMAHEFQTDAAELTVYLGPSAGVCCYEVGSEVAERFPAACVEERARRLYLDLKGANLQQLLDVGAERKNVEVSPHCTICEPDQFHSYRRDREESGRMMAVVSLIN
jgi:YfiH family protein